MQRERHREKAEADDARVLSDVQPFDDVDNARGLDDQALAAVAQWTFTPGELKGEKVPVLMPVVVSFRLR